MGMPSLLKYFAVVGSVLAGLLLMLNQLFGPEDSGKPQASAPQVVVVRHDPRASVMERWRNEQAALRAAEQTRTSPNASLVIKSEIAPPPVQPVVPREVPVAATAEPIQAQAQAQPAPLAQDEAAKLAEAKAKAARAKAHRERLARERERSVHQAASDTSASRFYVPGRERTAANQQDQYYYGQRTGGARPAQGPGYAYAPQQSFGPFGFGRVW